jgi:hypothetical protein
MLTKEGENDPSVLPAILIEYVQWCNIFLANLIGIIRSVVLFLDTRDPSRACLVLAISTSLSVTRVF